MASGEYPLLVILWDPMDPAVSEKASPEEVEEAVFGATPSIADYYATLSGSSVQITRAGVFSYRSDKPMDHYWNHPQPGQPGSDEFLSGHVEKWTEAIRKADAEFDFARLDLNKNKVLEPHELNILIVIPSVAPFGTVRPVVARELPRSSPLVVDGVRVREIAEVYAGSKAYGSKGLAFNFGAAAHEISHLLFGTADMYNAGPGHAGSYSLMDVTYTDAHLDPYHKSKLGWLNYEIVSAPGEYSLEAVEESRRVLVIPRPGPRVGKKSREFFVIENRQHGKYDTQLPDTGLAIWRIVDDPTQGDWARKNVFLMRNPAANGGDVGALWHDATAGEPALNWSDGKPSGITLGNFSPSGRVMSFTLRK